MNLEPEDQITEITIGPNGQIYLFGTSMQVMELLDHAQLSDAALKRRLAHLRAQATRAERRTHCDEGNDGNE